MALIKHDERYGPYMTANNAPAPYAATASQNNWGAFRAFSESLDDDISFTGLAAGAEQWVQITLDKAIRIWAFRIACRTTVSAKDAGQVPKNFKVQGSTDGATFEDIQTYTDMEWSQFTSWDASINKYDWGDSKKIEVSCTKEYQYYRFLFGECQSVSTQKTGSMTPTSSNTVKVTLIDMYQVEGEAGPEITGIRVTYPPGKKRYEIGESFDATGMEVMADMSDGKAQAVTDYTLSGYDSATTGQKTVTVTYQGHTATFDVTVYELSSIAITTPPDKVQYNVGDELDLTGMVVTATYSDGVTGAVTDYTVSGYDGSAAGTCTVVVAYQGEIASFEVTVAAASHILQEYIGSPNLEDVVATLDTQTGILTIAGVGATKNFSASGGSSYPYTSLFSEYRLEINEITVDDGITSLGKMIFSGMENVTQITLPEGIISLGDYAMSGLAVRTIVFPTTITSYGSGYVYQCTNLEHITIGGPSAVPIGNNFTSSPLKSLYIRGGKLASSDFTNSTLEEIHIGEWVEKIPDLCFASNAKLSKLIIDEGPITIGPQAFSGCPLLLNVTLPESVQNVDTSAFYDTGLESVTILNADAVIAPMPYVFPTATTIKGYSGSTAEDYAINYGRKFVALIVKVLTEYIGSPNLEDVVAELDTVTGVLTVSGNGRMKDFSAPGGSSYPFSELMFDHRLSINKIVVESGITNLGLYCFAGMENVTEVSLCEGMTEIGQYAFAGHKIQRMEIPETVLQFETSWFIGCNSLSYVKLGGENAGEIPTGLLSNTSVLKEIYVVGCAKIGKHELGSASSTIESMTIGVYVRAVESFSYCTSLKKIEVLAPITEIPDSFVNSCSALTSVVLPQSVTKMGYTAFGWCTSLESFTLPSELTDLGDACFMGCTKLTSIEFPPKLTSLPSGCFDHCGFTDIRIDDNCAVKTINNAFTYNDNLQNIYIGGQVTVMTEGVFGGCGSLNITINNKTDAIAGAPWGAAEDSTVTWLQAAQLICISITSLPDKVNYSIGEVFDGTGLVVSATYSDGSTEAVTDYTVTGFDGSAPGVHTVTVTYQGFTATFTVAVYGTVTGIRIAQYPDKVYYKLKDTLDTTGLQVVAVTEGGLERPITDYTLSALDSSTVGNKQITVTYEVPVSADTKAVYFAEFSVKVTATGDNPFEDNTIPYKITVHWINGEFADIGNDDLTGTMTLQESICSNNYFIFGGCICNQLSFATHSRQFMATDEDATPHGDIEVYVESRGTKVKIFTGTIDSGKRTAGLTQRNIIAYDYLYKFRNTDIAWWYKNKTADKNMLLTQKQFRDQLFDYLGIEQVPTKLYYDSALVPDTNLANEINVANILKDLCLQNSVFGWVNRDGKFEYLKLPHNSRVKSMDNAGNLKYAYYDTQIHVDTYESCEFTEGRIWYPKEFLTDPPVGVFTPGGLTAQEAYDANVYYNRNSFFVGNADWLDWAFEADEYGVYTRMEPTMPICYGTTSKTDDQHLYRAQGYTLTLRGNPLNKVGDSIEMTVRKTAADGTQLEWVIHSYIMSRTLKLTGDTSMVDIYSAKNGPYNGNDSQAGDNTAEYSAELFRLRSEGPTISYAPFTDGASVLAAEDVKKARLRCVKSLTEAEYTALHTAGGLRTDTLYFIKE